VVTVDWQAIGYSVAGSALFAAIARWTGAWRRFRERIARRTAVRRLRRDTLDAVRSATVIGRRQGFDIAQVYVALDLAVSDLMNEPDTARRRLPSSSVLVGGPGAGKSTYVKRRLMVQLEERELVFFLRLRDYAGDESIEAHFIAQLSRAGLPRPEVEFESQVLSEGTLVVLDGLDEVRPAFRDAVSQRINQFYKSYFGGAWDRSQLIVTCRKEAYRSIPLDIPQIWEVRPLTDEQIRRFAQAWPLGYPSGKSSEAFCADLLATPKILELARSPLLLVGGLMQYSESNLGIPEERFQYLARIGRWLVADWAAAQGLPPDPLRPLYDRILPRLAMEMHERAVAELPVDEATSLLTEWLPQYGASPGDASQVLDGVITRTGIVVRDIPGMIVFSQFSLQEYFASTVLGKSAKLQVVIDQGQMPWWREVVLLAIAQLDDPAAALLKLFDRDPSLAAESVAECPTPPLAIQNRAVDACLLVIDAGNAAAHRATVALLRKIAATPEANLIGALEERLHGTGEIASTVGLILAHAGTAAATRLLAAHVEVWEHCLKTAGYLSSSFEDVLVEVIERGPNSKALRAAELLTRRLSRDRRKQLVGLLKVLPSERAGAVSSLLVREIEIAPTEKAEFSGDLLQIAECATHIANLTELPDRRLNPPRRYPPTLGEISVVIAEVNGIRGAARIAAILDHGLRWPHERRSLGVFVAAGLAAVAGALPRQQAVLLFCAATAIVVIFGLLAEDMPGYTFITHPLVTYRPPWVSSALLAGAAIATGFFSPDLTRLGHVATGAAASAALVFALGAMGTLSAYFKTEGWLQLSLWRRAALVFFAVWYFVVSESLIRLLFHRPYVPATLGVAGMIAIVAVTAAMVIVGRHAHLFNEAAEIAANAYVPATEVPEGGSSRVTVSSESA